VLVDRILEHDAGGRLVASKNVTGSEDFFAGHFPGQPVMPGVLILESLAQAAGIWLLKTAADPRAIEIRVVGFDDTKFRRPVVPGDQLRLEVKLEHRRGELARFHGDVRVGEARAAEARLLLQIATLPEAEVDPLARVAPGAQLEPGVRVGPFCVVGAQVRLGRGSVLESHVVVDGDTRIGEHNRFFPFVSIGLVPQDLKYRGEDTRLEIGDRNVFREGSTVHRGTKGGGGVTRIGSDCLVMAQAHVAHDCSLGSHVILANSVALSGHVEVQDFATVGGLSGVHQFCRVGTHAFVGGASSVVKDVLPYSLVGRRPRALLWPEPGGAAPARLHGRADRRDQAGLPAAVGPGRPARRCPARGRVGRPAPRRRTHPRRVLPLVRARPRARAAPVGGGRRGGGLARPWPASHWA
jgi:UDP-N-acetylglucosamine acyltransferase